jgi:predicted peptidase
MKFYYNNDKLTHMGPMDAVIWKLFLRKYGADYYNYNYDVRVGTSIKLPNNTPDWVIASAKALSRKRIDVVMEDRENIYIVEVRPRFTKEAIGGALTYSLLYVRDYKPSKNVVPVIVFERSDPDVEVVAEMHGVKTVKV